LLSFDHPYLRGVILRQLLPFCSPPFHDEIEILVKLFNRFFNIPPFIQKFLEKLGQNGEALEKYGFFTHNKTHKIGYF
jgi:hypothetical protein